MNGQYRADQIGSLLRPPALLDARAAYGEGRLDAEGLRAAEDAAIRDALAMQRQVGIDVFTDGEYRRQVFYGDIVDAVEGFVLSEDVPLEWRGPAGTAGQNPGLAVGGKLAQKRRLTAHEVPFLQAHAPGPFKITLPSAQQFLRAGFRPGLTDAYYATREALAEALADIIHREVEALVAEGVPYIQIDAPWYMSFVDEQQRARMEELGFDPARELELAIRADNASVAGLGREGVVIALHMCRGNSRSRWFAEGSYEPIAEQAFGALGYGRLLLEYDSDRAGGFEPLRLVPPDKDVVLGLVTTKEGRLETEDALRRRIDEAARYVPLERLALSPQCGFASAMGGNALSMDAQRRKLELVAETARKVWG
jgi:5-methyltetrahydropteroyltriglutamate--homocysteine methyltransferase